MHHSRRKFYEQTSTHLGIYFHKLGLSPNFFTAVSLVSAVISGYFFWQEKLLWGVLFILVTSLGDMLDGATARAGNMGTLFGGILDHVSDRYGEFFILTGIAISGLIHPIWAIFALFGMIISSYTRAAAESIGNLPTCAVGFMGRLEKFVLIILGAILEHYYSGRNFLTYALIIVGTTSVITSIQRLAFARKQLRKRQS